MPATNPLRALVFIDGNNWYHSLKDAGVEHLRDLDYGKISKKIVGPRAWLGTRYYIGAVQQGYSRELYAEQRSFLSRLESTDKRITVHLGRLEPRKQENTHAVEMRQYISGLRDKMPRDVYDDLMNFSAQCQEAKVLVEKAVDVAISVDMLRMAIDNEYDHAYLLSADGDYTPVVSAVRKHGKNVYAASLSNAEALAHAANVFIPLKPDWLSDCYRDPPPPEDETLRRKAGKGQLPLRRTVVVSRPRRS